MLASAEHGGIWSTNSIISLGTYIEKEALLSKFEVKILDHRGGEAFFWS